MAVTRDGDWWARGTPIIANASDIDADDVSAASITSECLSANALRRSVIGLAPDLSAGSTAGLSTEFRVWVPTRPVTLQSAYMIPQAAWVATTIQTTPVATLYNGVDGSVIGTINISTTDPPAAGELLTFGTLSNTQVTAGSPVYLGLSVATSSGMDAPAHAVQIDWTSTD